MVKKLDHIAIVVKDLDKAVKTYEELFGFEKAEGLAGANDDFASAIVRLGDIRLELFQPLKKGTGFADFLEAKGGGIHHICFMTDDIAKEMKALKARGAKLQSEEPKQLPGAKIAFIDPSAAENVLIELMEPQKG